MIRTARYAAAYVALLAMMLHGLVPVGWMPNPTGQPFTICTVDGFQRVTLPQQHGDHAPAPAHDNSVCPFAATAHFAASTSAPLLIPRQTEIAVASFAVSSSPALAAPRDWNRGPRAPPAYS